jgi:hypothetical protein
VVGGEVRFSPSRASGGSEVEQLALDLEGLAEAGVVAVHVGAVPDERFAGCVLVNTETAGHVRSEWMRQELLGPYVRKMERRGFRVVTR